MFFFFSFFLSTYLYRQKFFAHKFERADNPILVYHRPACALCTFPQVTQTPYHFWPVVDQFCVFFKRKKLLTRVNVDVIVIVDAFHCRSHMIRNEHF